MRDEPTDVIRLPPKQTEIRQHHRAVDQLSPSATAINRDQENVDDTKEDPRDEWL